MGIVELRAQMNDALGRVTYQNAVLPITKNRKTVAYFLSVERYNELLKLEALVNGGSENDANPNC